MCGFIGIIPAHTAAGSLLKARVGRGLEWLRRRGPDSQRLWSTSDTRISVGFARLAIVDRDAAADQPFSAADAGLTVVLNGEIYNYSELRQQLTDYPFRTVSDTEVLLAAFSRWRVSGLARLRGMFASAIVDAMQKRVYLVRDPVGKKPLFVYQEADGVVFGSSVMAILAAGARKTQLDYEAVTSYWENGYVAPDKSILKACRPLMPGEVLEYDWQGQLIQKHSCRPTAGGSISGSVVEAEEECRRLLKQSVIRRLHNNPHPVGLLSGGIDSTVVIKTVQEVSRANAITLAGGVGLTPDHRHARYAARRLGVPLQSVRLASRSIAEDAQWALSLQDEPLGMMSFLPLAHLVKRAKDYSRILLTGDGGDEVFLGYGRSSDWLRRNGGSELLKDSQWTVGTEPPPWMSEWGRFLVRDQLLGHMFPKVDRAAAEQGVEIRSPLLDWDLLAFARRLPPDALMRDNRMKVLLKAQLRGWPETFLERPKVGFTFRLRWLWLFGRYEGVREIVSDESVQRFRAVLPSALRRSPRNWSDYGILRNFTSVWKLLAWSEFEKRMTAATREASTVRSDGNATHLAGATTLSAVAEAHGY